jgi:hypothetical protein
MTGGFGLRSRTVPAEDGVPLHVELDGDPDAPLTAVLTHGFTASLDEWETQLPALRDRARLVRALGLLRLWLAVLQRTAPLLERVRRRRSVAGRWFTRRYHRGARRRAGRRARGEPDSAGRGEPGLPGAARPGGRPGPGDRQLA